MFWALLPESCMPLFARRPMDNMQLAIGKQWRPRTQQEARLANWVTFSTCLMANCSPPSSVNYIASINLSTPISTSKPFNISTSHLSPLTSPTTPFINYIILINLSTPISTCKPFNPSPTTPLINLSTPLTYQLPCNCGLSCTFSQLFSPLHLLNPLELNSAQPGHLF